MSVVKGADLIFETENLAQTQGREVMPKGIKDPRRGFQYVNHFLQALPTATGEFLISSLNGAGATFTIGNRSGQLGIGIGNTGTTATGRGGVQTSLTALLIPTGEQMLRFMTKLRMPILSDAVETFAIRGGFLDNAAADSTDGAYFTIDPFSIGDSVRCTTANGGVRTNSDITIPNTWLADTDYTFTIDLYATRAEYTFVDAGSGQSLVKVISTNLPAGAASFGVGLSITKTLGITARTMESDYFLFDGSI